MENISKYECQKNIEILRFYTPEHGNTFLMQLFSYSFFALNVLRYIFNNQKKYDIIFATSSRLGTGVLGFLVSKIIKKPLYLDIRDVFSDNLKSFALLKGFIGKIFIKKFAQIESLIIDHAKWTNFVSPGFFNYPHIKNLRKEPFLFTNGIDDIFINNRDSNSHLKIRKSFQKPLKIVYAGNIGFGQGLELIILPLADYYKQKVLFQIIGDGNSIDLIKNGISKKKINNIQLIPPVNRDLLLNYYNDADLFLLHLNEIPSLIRVLPSKIFDYGSFDKPILAGVEGVAHSFIKKHLPSSFLFKPGDHESLIPILNKVLDDGLPLVENSSFIEKFSRKKIMDSMLESIILNYEHNFIKP